jgi:uncharacterized protein DUF4386
VLPGPRPSDAEVLASVGIDLVAVRDRLLETWVGLDAPVIFGGLQDAVQQRPAGHDGVVADRGAQVVLPAAHDTDGDRAELPLPQGWQQVQPQARLGGLEGPRAVVGVGRPAPPPLARPSLERRRFQSRRTCRVPLLLATPLLVITLGDRLRDGTVDASASQQLGSLLQAQHDVAIVIVYLIVSVGGGILAFLLYQTRLIPRWLAVIGVIAYPVLFVGTVLDMFDLADVTQGAGLLAVVPGGLFELILPIWLLTKGFTTSGHQEVDRRDAVVVGVGRP